LAEPLTRILSTVVKFPETGNPVLDAIIGELRASARGWRRRRSMLQKPRAHSLQIAGVSPDPPPRAPACVRVCVPSRRTPAPGPTWLGSSRADLMDGGQDGRSPNRWCARPLAMAQ
jgi:hypothetical protein